MASYRTHSDVRCVKNSYLIDVSRDINSKIYESVILRETYFSIGKLPMHGRSRIYHVDRWRVNRVTNVVNTFLLWCIAVFKVALVTKEDNDAD